MGAGRGAAVVALAGAAGVAGVVLTLRLGTRLLPLPLLILGGGFELRTVLEPLPHAALPLYAASLLLLGELIAWSVGLRGIALLDGRLVSDRVAFLAATAFGAAAVAAAVDGASAVRLTGGLGDAVLGSAAALLAIAFVFAAARRRAT